MNYGALDKMNVSLPRFFQQQWHLSTRVIILEFDLWKNPSGEFKVSLS